MSLLLVAAALAVAPPVPPPPVTAAPMSPAMFDRMVVARASIPVAEFDLEVRGGGAVLWSGPMRVSGRSGASFNRQKSDAPAAECAVDTPYGYGGGLTRDSLTVSLNASRGAGDAVRYQITVSWNRPAGDDCTGEQSSRSVGLTQSFDAGQRDVTITGDGGLMVKLKRR